MEYGDDYFMELKVNLDDRYYTEDEVDSLIDEKLGSIETVLDEIVGV